MESPYEGHGGKTLCGVQETDCIYILLQACIKHSETRQGEGTFTPSFVSNSLAELGEEHWDEGLIQDVAGTMFGGEH